MEIISGYNDYDDHQLWIKEHLEKADNFLRWWMTQTTHHLSQSFRCPNKCQNRLCDFCIYHPPMKVKHAN